MKPAIVFMLVICAAGCLGGRRDDDGDGVPSALNIGYLLGPIKKGLGKALNDLGGLIKNQKNVQDPRQFKHRVLDAVDNIVKGVSKTLDRLFPGLFLKLYPVYKKVSNVARSTLNPVAKGLTPIVTPLVRGQILNQDDDEDSGHRGGRDNRDRGNDEGNDENNAEDNNQDGDQ